MRAHPFTNLQSREDLERLGLILAVGSRDLGEARRGTAALHCHLEARGIPHGYVRYDGGHDWSSWRSLLPALLCLQLDPDCRLPPDDRYTIEVS